MPVPSQIQPVHSRFTAGEADVGTAMPASITEPSLP